MNVGCCFDDLISTEMNSYVPKNKSFLKLSELNLCSTKSIKQKKEVQPSYFLQSPMVMLEDKINRNYK